MAHKVKVKIFDDMKEAFRYVAAYERGERVNLRVTHIPSRSKKFPRPENRHTGPRKD